MCICDVATSPPSSWRGGLGFCGAHCATCDQRRTHQGRDHAIGTQALGDLVGMVRRDHAIGLEFSKRLFCMVWWDLIQFWLAHIFPRGGEKNTNQTTNLFPFEPLESRAVGWALVTCLFWTVKTMKIGSFKADLQVKQFSIRRCCLANLELWEGTVGIWWEVWKTLHLLFWEVCIYIYMFVRFW